MILFPGLIKLIKIVIGLGILALVFKKRDLDSIFKSVGRSEGVDWKLIKAVAMKESSLRPNIRTPEPDGTTTYGLMQVKYETAEWLGFKGRPEQLLSPKVNVTWGTRYLKYQLKRYNGDIAKSVAAYNMGTARYSPSGGFLNQAYVTAVLANQTQVV